MELVIKISDEEYEKISNSNPSYANDFNLYYAIKNSTPLPKRIADADAIIDGLKGIEKLHINDELRSNILDIINSNIIVEADKVESEDRR